MKFVQYSTHENRLIFHRVSRNKFHIYCAPAFSEFSLEWVGYGGDDRYPVVFNIPDSKKVMAGAVGSSHKKMRADNVLGKLREMLKRRRNLPVGEDTRNFEVIIPITRKEYLRMIN